MTEWSDKPGLLSAAVTTSPGDRSAAARNVAFLMAGQTATAAVAFGVTAILARHLAAHDFGVFYLAATLVQSAFSLADLGQEYYVVGSIARDRARTAVLFGTGLVLRLVVGVAAYPLLLGLGTLLRYPESTRDAVSLTVAFFLIGAVGDGVTVVLRGLERMGLEAALRVLAKALVGIAIVLAVAAKGGLPAVLLGQVLGGVAGALVYGIALPRFGIARPQFDVPTAKAILAGGLPFLIWVIVVNAQPTIDAVLLSVMTPPSVIGWYAAAWKLVGILTFPATMPAAALYPTLSRLHDQRSAIYTDVLAGALKAAVLVGVLTAAGTYLFADIAVAIVYGQATFAPAADNLKLLAGYLLLVFVNITLGGAVMAAGLQTRWILAKLLAVSLATGLALGLVPLAQATTANGGLGCAMATVVAEVLMFIAAIRLIPADRMRLTRGLARDFARAAGAAAVMAASGLLFDSGPLGRIAVATLAYVASVCLLGAIRREDISLLRDMVRLRSPA